MAETNEITKAVEIFIISAPLIFALLGLVFTNVSQIETQGNPGLTIRCPTASSPLVCFTKVFIDNLQPVFILFLFSWFIFSLSYIYSRYFKYLVSLSLFLSIIGFDYGTFWLVIYANDVGHFNLVFPFTVLITILYIVVVLVNFFWKRSKR
jgi:hypothetical protein